MTDNQILDMDDDIIIKISKKSRGTVNDSLSESANSTVGDFICDFV